MKFVIFAALFVVAATVVGASSVRVKKDVGSKNSEQCVYADVSKTGKKTIICGDPAPPTLASILTSQLQQRKSTGPEARIPSEKCLDLHKPKQTPVSVYVQPQQQYEQPHYEQLHVMHHQVPQVQYVQQQPQVHYVHQQQPLVHYQPTVVYQKPAVQLQPYKSPCSQYGGYSDGGYSSGYGYSNGGYGGYGGYGSYGGYTGGGYRMADDASPVAVPARAVDEMAGADDVYDDEAPIMQNYLEAGPYEGNAAMARKGFGGGRPRTVEMRPLFVPAMLRSADQYGYEDGAGPEWQPQQRFVSEPELQFPGQLSQQPMVGRFSGVERSMASAVAEGGPLDRRQLAYSGYVPVRPETIMPMTDRYNFGGYSRTAGQPVQQEQQMQQLQQQQLQQQQLQQQQMQQEQQQQQQPQQQLPSSQDNQSTGGEVDGALAAVPAKADPKDLKPADRKKNVKN